MRINFFGWLVVVVAAGFSSAASASQQSKCIREIQIQQMRSETDIYPNESFTSAGYWAVRSSAPIEGIVLLSSTAGSGQCISDIKFIPSTDEDSPPPAPAGYEPVAQWRVDYGGGWPTWRDTKDQRSGMAGLYVKRLARGHSGSVVTELRSVASSVYDFADAPSGYRQIGSWDAANQFRAQGTDGATGSWMFTLQAKRACHLEPNSGWESCHLMESYPGVAIVASPKVTTAAVPAVEEVFTRVFEVLRPEHRPATMNGFTAYITNGETSAELDELWVVNAIHLGNRPPHPDDPKTLERDKLRGGASADYLWISEGMICKTGNIGYNQTVIGWNREALKSNSSLLESVGKSDLALSAEAAKLEKDPRSAEALTAYNGMLKTLNVSIGDRKLKVLYPIDTSYRSFDQVVHELAHSLDFRFGRRPALEEAFRAARGDSWPEPSANATQRVFSVPKGNIGETERQFMDSLFTDEAFGVTFDCQPMYEAKP